MASMVFGAVRAALLDVLQLLVRLALPISILLGLSIIGLAFLFYRDPEGWKKSESVRATRLASISGVIGVLLVGYLSYSVLQQLLPAAREQYNWQESTEATSKPKVDAPPVVQYGPVVAELQEKTYTRSLTLPPDFATRIGTEGVQILAPYLQDPTTENVLKLTDSFKRNGQNVLFTREVTRMEEFPMPMADSKVAAKIHRREGRSYELDFQANYSFRNDQAKAINARFQFPMPSSGTVKNLKVLVDGQLLPDPNEQGQVEWTGTMEPGQTKSATVSYQTPGGDAWQYDMGSQRRRVEKFLLTTDVDGPTRFQRGAIEPTRNAGRTLEWQLDNVITSQKIAIAFPPNVIDRETYFQALEAMPAAVVLFIILAVAAISWRRQALRFSLLIQSIAILAIGFALAMVTANYIGNVAAVLLTPVLGGILTGTILRPAGWLSAIVACLVPACFLSAEHTGLLMGIMLLIAAFLFWRDSRKLAAK